MTFVAALRCDRVDAPWVLNGPINANAFLTYIAKELVKTLSPNDIVVLDNLGSHKGQAVRQAIRRAGARIAFLPPYSPDLNPIEQLFSKIKPAMRTAMARSEDAVHEALAQTIKKIQPSECANHIRNAGYQVNLNAKRSSRMSWPSLIALGAKALPTCCPPGRVVDLSAGDFCNRVQNGHLICEYVSRNCYATRYRI